MGQREALHMEVTLIINGVRCRKLECFGENCAISLASMTPIVQSQCVYAILTYSNSLAMHSGGVLGRWELPHMDVTLIIDGDRCRRLGIRYIIAGITTTA